MSGLDHRKVQPSSDAVRVLSRRETLSQFVTVALGLVFGPTLLAAPTSRKPQRNSKLPSFVSPPLIREVIESRGIRRYIEY
jgi:hypothetical protein